MNVDQAEVKKFDDMAAHWWDLKGPCKPLHELNPIRLSFIQSCCVLTEQKILDVGCGGGILTEALSQFSQHVIGLDQAAAAISVAKAHAQALTTPPDYQLATTEDFADSHPQAFDIITCMEMLEHVPDPLSIIAAISKLLKPGGHAFFSTLNRTPKAFLQAIIGAEYLLRILPRGTHDYERFIRPSELTKWAQTQDLALKSLKGVTYHLLSKSFSLSSDVSVNYIMHLQKEPA